MNSFNFLQYIRPELLTLLAIDLVIAIALLSLMRFISGLWAKVNTTHELSEKDNFAFGISIAGGIIAMGIVLTGAITGEAANSYLAEAIGVASYGLVGLSLIKIGRFIHDKVSLHHIDKAEQIRQENISVAIVDAAAVIATAIIIRSVLLWVEGINAYTFIAIVSGFAVSQAVLVFVTRLREHQYAKNNQDASFQQALLDGQTALAIRHAGHMIATALAVKAASYFLIYQPTEILGNLIGWLGISLAMAAVIYVLNKLARAIILMGINTSVEVDQQENIGVAAAEFAIVVSIALITVSLMA
ncbi:hypothetical protein DS2_06051 [Catenovulum agarivorans DS-2]|uniref:ATP synthase F0 subunit A n=1 Tax=Catenovulum agarivorans DS-2 TaxID=1328313 RepID=W7QZP2_9ALTE|nr:DUF350 domain-containing protein [Catenovulum agarivorans]EWH10830.1 hypothetical protein DS2_06051 [Catenovulum agarivorans DS-2]